MQCLKGHSGESKPYVPFNRKLVELFEECSIAEGKACERRWVTTLASECWIRWRRFIFFNDAPCRIELTYYHFTTTVAYIQHNQRQTQTVWNKRRRHGTSHAVIQGWTNRQPLDRSSRSFVQRRTLTILTLPLKFRTFKNPRRRPTAAILKTAKPRYLVNGSIDYLHKIWHGDAYWSSEPYGLTFYST